MTQTIPRQPVAGEALPLPKPRLRAGNTLEQAISRRRSRRTFSEAPLSLVDLTQLLWAAQGVTGDYDLRAAPSAGRIHPIRIYVVAGQVDGLEPGCYLYEAGSHQLRPVARGDLRADLRAATSHQECLCAGAADLIVAAAPQSTLERFGERGHRYVHMEAGHVAQNIYLQAAAMRLSTTAVANFDDQAMARAGRLAAGEIALYVMPVGHPGV